MSTSKGPLKNISPGAYFRNFTVLHSTDCHWGHLEGDVCVLVSILINRLLLTCTAYGIHLMYPSSFGLTHIDHMSHFFTCYFPDNRLNNLCIVPSANESSNVQLKCTERFDLCLFYYLLYFISSWIG